MWYHHSPVFPLSVVTIMLFMVNRITTNLLIIQCGISTRVHWFAFYHRMIFPSILFTQWKIERLVIHSLNYSIKLYFYFKNFTFINLLALIGSVCRFCWTVVISQKGREKLHFHAPNGGLVFFVPFLSRGENFNKMPRPFATKWDRQTWHKHSTNTHAQFSHTTHTRTHTQCT